MITVMAEQKITRIEDEDKWPNEYAIKIPAVNHLLCISRVTKVLYDTNLRH
jgi:hypothetical protein